MPDILESPAEVAEPIESTEGDAVEVEQPEGETQDSTDELGEDDTEAEGEEDAEGEEPAKGEKRDDRQIAASVKNGLAKLRGVDPVAAKELKGIYYTNQDYRAAFPTLAEATAAKTLIEEVGGQKGIQAIHAEREEWNQLDEMYAKGDKEFVRSIAEANPEAFQKTAAHVINEFAARAPEQYQYYANNVAVNTLAGSGISIDALANAYQRYADNPQAQAIIAEVHNALVGIKEKAAQFEQKRTDPREAELKQKETAFEERRRADFESGIEQKATTYLTEKMQPEINLILAGRKVDQEAMATMQALVQREVERRLGEVPNFANQLEAYYRTGDSEKSLTYVQRHYDRLLPDAVKKVIAPLYRGVAAAPKPKVTASGKPVSAGEIFLKEMPDHSQVDMTKTTVADLIQGHAIMKSGKRATGWA